MRQLKITQSITPRNGRDSSLQKYLQDIGKFDLLTAEEEIELAIKIKQGDEKAAEKMTKANLRFVVSVAKQYQNQGLSLPDLINEGNLGLIKAVRRFDETRGFKFISYAVWRIRQSILMALAEQSRTIRLPLNQVGSVNKINKETSRLEQQLERMPTTEELAEALDLDEYDVKSSLIISRKNFSTDEPLINDDESSSSFLDTFVDLTQKPTDHKVAYTDSLRQEIAKVLSTLSERENAVIKAYFGLTGEAPLTLDEIAEKYDLTRERVRQIKEKGIRRLRNQNRAKNLKGYL